MVSDELITTRILRCFLLINQGDSHNFAFMLYYFKIPLYVINLVNLEDKRMLKKYLFGGMPLWQVFWIFGVCIPSVFVWSFLSVFGTEFSGYTPYLVMLVGLIYFGITNFAIMNSAGAYKGADVFKFFSFILSLVFLIFSFGSFIICIVAMFFFN